MKGLLGLLVAVALSGLLEAPDGIQVTPLAREGRVLVSFTLTGGMSDEMREAIHSGLPTVLTYDVELRRAHAFWFDRTLATATVTASVQYDNLTRRHQISRSVDGRVEDSRITEDEQIVGRWLTAFDHIVLCGTDGLEPNSEYYVWVRARTRPRVSWFFWPWDRGWASGRAAFTFIP
jgi:hypothetical protein